MVSPWISAHRCPSSCSPLPARRRPEPRARRRPPPQRRHHLRRRRRLRPRCTIDADLHPEPRPPRGRRAALHRRHCSAATCPPSRFAPHRGPWLPARVRVLPPNAPLTIPTDWLTLQRVFESAGYRTAVVGKWHLGLGERGTPVDWNGDVKPGPLELGFDTSFLLPSTNDRVPCVYLDGHRVLGLDPADPCTWASAPRASRERSTNGKKDRAAMTYYASSHGHDNSVIGGIGRIGFQWGGESALGDEPDDGRRRCVDRARLAHRTARRRKEPFLLYFSSQDIHVPRTPHPRFQGKSELGYRGDAMVQLDWAAGALMDALDELGLAEDTIVIFSSDNGPCTTTATRTATVLTSTESDRGHDGPLDGGQVPHRGGGTRVPLIVRWPGRVEPGVSDAPSVRSTCSRPSPRSSRSRCPASPPWTAATISRRSSGTTRRAPRSSSRRPAPSPSVRRLGCVRRPKGGLALFDLAADPAETTNRLKTSPNARRSSPRPWRGSAPARASGRSLDDAGGPGHPAAVSMTEPAATTLPTCLSCSSLRSWPFSD